MTDSPGKRPATLHALIAVLAFQGVSGVAGGLGLVADPSGRSLGIPLEWLAGSLFGSYLIPGLVLFTVLGIGPLLVVYGLWTRRSWSRSGSLMVGAALLAWLGVEIAVIGYQPRPPLQLIYGVVGVAIVALAMLPAARTSR